MKKKAYGEGPLTKQEKGFRMVLQSLNPYLFHYLNQMPMSPIMNELGAAWDKFSKKQMPKEQLYNLFRNPTAQDPKF